MDWSQEWMVHWSVRVQFLITMVTCQNRVFDCFESCSQLKKDTRTYTRMGLVHVLIPAPATLLTVHNLKTRSPTCSRRTAAVSGQNMDEQSWEERHFTSILVLLTLRSASRTLCFFTLARGVGRFWSQADFTLPSAACVLQ